MQGMAVTPIQRPGEKTCFSMEVEKFIRLSCHDHLARTRGQRKEEPLETWALQKVVETIYPTLCTPFLPELLLLGNLNSSGKENKETWTFWEKPLDPVIPSVGIEKTREFR